MKNNQWSESIRRASQSQINITLIWLLLLLSFAGCQGQISQKEKLSTNPSTPQDSLVYNQYKNGKKDGLWREFDGNNRLISEGNYKNGQANGLMRWYHEKGHLAGEGLMKDGLREGLWKVYAIEDGKLAAEVLFEAGKKIGVKRLYHENEQLKQENTWEGKEIISKKCWDENGEVITCPPN